MVTAVHSSVFSGYRREKRAPADKKAADADE
jgi:hypothetical protein